MGTYGWDEIQKWTPKSTQSPQKPINQTPSRKNQSIIWSQLLLVAHQGVRLKNYSKFKISDLENYMYRLPNFIFLTLSLSFWRHPLDVLSQIVKSYYFILMNRFMMSTIKLLIRLWDSLKFFKTYPRQVGTLSTFLHLCKTFGLI